MSGYPANPVGPTRIDPIGEQAITRVGFRFGPWLSSLNLASLGSATWETADGITLSNPSIVPDEGGNLTVATVYVAVTTAALNSTVKATVEATSGLNVERRSLLMQVAEL